MKSCRRSPVTLSHLVILLSLIASFDVRTHAQIPTSELTGLSRNVVQVGVPSETMVQGARLDEITQVLVTDFIGTPIAAKATAKLAPGQPMRDYSETSGALELLIDPMQQPGLVELRTVGRFGVSNPRCVLLSALPVDVPTGDHSNSVTAHPIKFGQLINDRLLAKTSSFYRATIASGHQLRCVAYAKQLDSQADLNVRLLDAKGVQLASSRALGLWPAELKWANSSADSQEIVVEVRDLLYRGGEGFHFVLEARTDDAKSDLAANPLHLDQLLRPTLEPTPAPGKLSHAAAIVLRESNWIDAGPLPNEKVVSFPKRIRSDLSEQRIVRFEAQKDQQLSFEILSNTLDQLTDPAIIVYKVNPGPQPDSPPQLQQLAEQDDTPVIGTAAVRFRRLDPQLVWKAPETATYQLLIVDRQSGTRPTDSRGMLLEIRSAQPDFALMAHQPFPTNNPAVSRPWGSQLMRNASLQLHVSVLRKDGFNDAIELMVEGLPAGCRCPNVIVPAGANEADLVIQVAGDAETAVANLAVVGQRKNGDQLVIRRAAWSSISMAATATYNTVCSRRSGPLGIQINSLDTFPLQVQLGDGTTLDVKAGSKFNLPVKLIRQPGSAAECTLRPQALPAKIGLAEFKIAGDKAEASPEVNVPADAPVGEYTFWVQTETKVKWRANPQVLTREEAYLAKLKSALEANSTGDVPKAQIETAATKSAARIEELKKQTAEAEHTVFLPSNPIRIRILPKD